MLLFSNSVHILNTLNNIFYQVKHILSY